MVGAAGATQIIEDSSEWGTDDSWWAMPARELDKYSHGSNVASSIDWSVALGTWTRLWTLRGSTVLSLSEMEVEAPQAAQGSLLGSLPKPVSGSHEGRRHWSPMGHCFRFSSDRHLSLPSTVESSRLHSSPRPLTSRRVPINAAQPTQVMLKQDPRKPAATVPRPRPTPAGVVQVVHANLHTVVASLCLHCNTQLKPHTTTVSLLLLIRGLHLICGSVRPGLSDRHKP